MKKRRQAKQRQVKRRLVKQRLVTRRRVRQRLVTRRQVTQRNVRKGRANLEGREVDHATQSHVTLHSHLARTRVPTTVIVTVASAYADRIMRVWIVLCREMRSLVRWQRALWDVR